MTKQLSAVDEALQEINAEGFRLTDDIIITPPSRKKAEEIAKLEDPQDVLKVILGDQYEAAVEVLENLPLTVEIRVMEKMLKALTSDLPTVDDIIERLGLTGSDAAQIAKKAAEAPAV